MLKDGTIIISLGITGYMFILCIILEYISHSTSRQRDREKEYTYVHPYRLDGKDCQKRY